MDNQNNGIRNNHNSEISQKNAFPLDDKLGSWLRVFFFSAVVLAILTSLFFPFSRSRGTLSSRRMRACISNMRTLEGAVEMFLMDFDVEKLKSHGPDAFKNKVSDKDKRGLIKNTSAGLIKYKSDKSTNNSDNTESLKKLIEYAALFPDNEGETGSFAPLLKLLVKEKYIKTAPQCKSDGEYRIKKEFNNYIVECSKHGTVENAHALYEEEKKEKLWDLFYRDILFSIFAALILTFVPMSRLKEFAVKEPGGNTFKSGFFWVYSTLFLSNMYAAVIVSQNGNNYSSNGVPVSYFVLIILLRILAYVSAFKAFTEYAWAKRASKGFFYSAIICDTVIFFTGLAIMSKSYGSMPGYHFLAGLVLLTLILPYIYVKLKEGIWLLKPDNAKELIYKRPYTIAQKFWLFIIIVLVFYFCRTLIVEQTTRGVYSVQSSVSNARRCAENIENVEKAVKRFLEYSLTTEKEVSRFFKNESGPIKNTSDLIKKGFLKSIPYCYRNTYSIIPDESEKSFTVKCSEHGTRQSALKLAESKDEDLVVEKLKHQSKSLIKVLMLSVLFALLLVMRLRPGKGSPGSNHFMQLVFGDKDKTNSYRLSFAVFISLIVYLAFFDIAFVRRSIEIPVYYKNYLPVVLIVLRSIFYFLVGRHIYIKTSIESVVKSLKVFFIFSLLLDIIVIVLLSVPSFKAEGAGIMSDVSWIYILIQLFTVAWYHFICCRAVSDLNKAFISNKISGETSNKISGETSNKTSGETSNKTSGETSAEIDKIIDNN